MLGLVKVTLIGESGCWKLFSNEKGIGVEVVVMKRLVNGKGRDVGYGGGLGSQ